MIGITGGSGVLGKCLIDVMNRKKIHNYNLFEGDITKKSEVKFWIDKNKDFDAIIHLAALVPLSIVSSNLTESWKVNVLGSLYLIETLREADRKIKFLYASTSHVYKKSIKTLKEKSKVEPINFYGLSKLHAEQILKLLSENSKIELIIARIFSFTSIYQKPPFFIPTLINKIATAPQDGIVQMGSLDAYRDFLDGHDVANALLLLLRNNVNGVFNICSNKPYYLRDIFLKAIKLLNRSDVILKEMQPSKEHHYRLVGDNSRLNSLGFRPNLNNIDKILTNYINNYKSNIK